VTPTAATQFVTRSNNLPARQFNRAYNMKYTLFARADNRTAHALRPREFAFVRPATAARRDLACTRKRGCATACAVFRGDHRSLCRLPAMR
jgi:hypothetical protein